MFRIGSYQNTPELYRLEFDEVEMVLGIKIWKSRWETTKLFLTKNVDPTTVDVFESVCAIDTNNDPHWVIIYCKLPNTRDKTTTYRQTLAILHIVEALELLFSALSYVLVTHPSDSSLSQRAEVNILYTKERKFFGISACLGHEVRTWIETHDYRSTERRITARMQHVSRHIFMQNDKLFNVGIHVLIPKDRRIIFHCWGDACDLSAYDPEDSEFGIDLRCHNVDNPFQVLILLVGLVGLYEEFEKSQL